MKLAVFSALLLSALVSGAPTSSEDDDNLILTRDFFPKEYQIYEAKHNIVKIVTPSNHLNIYGKFVSIFFVEADEKDEQRVDQGLYIMKQDNVTKLLDNGRDITVPMGHNKIAYFAAKDGIYIYNDETNTAEKYGTVNDDLIGITSFIYHPIFNTSDNLYVLTANKEVFKVTDEGTKKVKVDNVKNAEQIVLDYSNNLFYADSKDVYVVNDNGVKKISLPENHSKITLIRPSYSVKEGIVVLVDKVVYKAFPNGTAESAGVKVDAPVTAISVELSYNKYFGYEKKIYSLDFTTSFECYASLDKSCINKKILRKFF